MAAFVTCSFLWVACEKEMDEEPPVMKLTRPFEHQSFNVFDTINVYGTISDNENLCGIEIRLVDDQLTPVLPSLFVRTSSKSLTLDSPYVLSDIHLESGKYFIRVSAEDGKNEKREYIEINITAVPKVREGIVLVSTSNDKVDVSILRESGELDACFQLEGDYSGSGVSSYHQYINVAGSVTGDLISTHATTKEIRWSVPVISGSGSPYFEHLNFQNGLSYVCFRGGEVFAYDEGKKIRFSALTPEEYYPEMAYEHEEVVYVEQQKRNGSGKQLVGYFSTGFEKKVLPLNGDVIAMGAGSNQEVLVFVNEGGNGRILNHDVSTSSFSELVSVPSGVILDVAEMSSGNFIIAHETGMLRFNHNQLSLTPWFGGASMRIAYDVENDQLITADGTGQVEVYDAGNGTIVASHLHPSPIEAIHILYNR